jgi:serine/threonine protein kinase
MHGHLADDQAFRERFIQEARSAARLSHPNLVGVYDQGAEDDCVYIVMEYIPGITLRDLLQEHRALTPEQATDILRAVLAGLASAHRAGIVHRDLKPENVLLADDGRIKLGDFGLARATTAIEAMVSPVPIVTDPDCCRVGAAATGAPDGAGAVVATVVPREADGTVRVCPG